MKIAVRKRRAPSIIIVSLVDILTILLIFFVVSTTFKKDQPEVQINLPESKTAANAAGPLPRRTPTSTTARMNMATIFELSKCAASGIDISVTATQAMAAHR